MVYVLVTLCAADKRLAKAAVATESFLLPDSVLRSPPPNQMYAQMMGINSVESLGVAGAAIEHRSLLGRVLRFGADPLDPKIADMFKSAYRESQKIVEGNMHYVRNNLVTLQNLAFDLIMVLLKAGGEAKERVLLWLTQAIEYNAEAEKDRPSRFVAASGGFLLNLTAVMLRIARPVLEDKSKLLKVDWRYISSDESRNHIFKSDLTKLATLDTPSDGIEDVQPKIDFNFITQSFFLTWRVLHLGAAQTCDHYENMLRSLNHYHDQLETGNPHAVYSLLQKLCADITLLAPNTLNDLVQFCCAACESLLHALESPSSSEKRANNEEGWLVSEATLTPRARMLLHNLPEHLVDDLMDVLLFVAKTRSSTFAAFPMNSVLSLIVFFLRRPWAVTSPHLR